VYTTLQTQDRITVCPQGQPGSSGLPPVSAPPSHGAAVRHHSGGSDRLRCAQYEGQAQDIEPLGCQTPQEGCLRLARLMFPCKPTLACTLG